MPTFKSTLLKSSRQDKLLLHYIKHFNLERIKFHLMRGADPDIRDINNEPALIMAANLQGFEVAQMLLEVGANVNASYIDRFAFTQSALSIAISNNNFLLVKLLIDNQADVNFVLFDRSHLTIACEFGYMDIIQELLDAGANLHFKGYYRSEISTSTITPLTLGIRNNNSKLVSILLSLGALKSYESIDGSGGLNEISRDIEAFYPSVKAAIESYLLNECSIKTMKNLNIMRLSEPLTISKVRL